MLLPRLTNCPECASIPSLLANIDCKLNQLASALYNNTIFALNQPISAVTMLDLLNYKRILAYRICNPNYAGLYTLNMIASRVIILTGNCKTNCGGASQQNVPVHTTTTSTSCIPRTTTTTTTHSPTTTTTTTSGGSTTTTTSSSTTTTSTTIAPIDLRYGYLYDKCAALNELNIASSGWHVPTFADWEALFIYMGDYSLSTGGKLKEVGLTNWKTPNTGATNEFGFTAVGSGNRLPNGIFQERLDSAYWWANDPSNNNVSAYYNTATISAGYTNLQNGLSIRLMKDTQTVQPDGTVITNGYIGNDGKQYDTVVINNYEWTLINLLETKYRDSSSIPEVQDNTEWANEATCARCRYDTGITTTTTTTTASPTTTTTTTSIVPPIVEQYGYLYNDRIVDEPNFAPVGWRIPTYHNIDGSPGDWIQLQNYLTSVGYGSNFSGVLKSTRTQPTASPSWLSPNTGALDIYGFNCLPAGYRSTSGVFTNLTSYGSLLLTGYSSVGTPVWGCIQFIYLSGVWGSSAGTSPSNQGLSARFIKEDPGTWSPGDTITDNDGNIYPTVQIGTQVWTALNWKSTKYTNGSTIPMLQDDTAWASASSGAMCYYTIP